MLGSPVEPRAAATEVSGFLQQSAAVPGFALHRSLATLSASLAVATFFACADEPADSGAETMPPTVTVRFLRWEPDRACWGTLDLEKDARTWTEYSLDDDTAGFCLGTDDRSQDVLYKYGATDGGCYGIQVGLNGEDSLRGDVCDVSDPWILPCSASDVAGCCEIDGVLCSPDPYYQTGT
jgi:hypothetical protein